VKKLLSQEETMVPALFHNLRRALMPFMDEGIYTDIKRVCSDIEERSQKRVKHSQEKNEDDDPDSGSRNIKRPRVHHLAPTTATKTDGSEGVRSTCQDGYCVPCYELA
jgi:hypothetical protein